MDNNSNNNSYNSNENINNNTFNNNHQNTNTNTNYHNDNYQNRNSYNPNNNYQFNNSYSQNGNYYNSNQNNNSYMNNGNYNNSNNYNNGNYNNTHYNINSKSYSTNVYDELPEEVNKWNWGAFMFPLFWGIGNKCYLTLLTFIPYIGLIMRFICGALGNKWAYDKTATYYDSPEEFSKAQQSWNRGGFAAFIATIAVIVISIFIAIVLAYTVFSNGNRIYNKL